MSALGIISGYSSGSDNESDGNEGAPKAPLAGPSESKAASKTADRLGGFLATLTPPKASSTSTSTAPPTSPPPPPKRKQHQIRVETTRAGDSGSRSDADLLASAVSVKTKKMSRLDSPGPNGGASSSKHGLLSMLPAPTRKSPPTSPRRREEDQSGKVRLNTNEPTPSFGQNDKKKGNADFRAMLGLKPKVPLADVTSNESWEKTTKGMLIPLGHQDAPLDAQQRRLRMDFTPQQTTAQQGEPPLREQEAAASPDHWREQANKFTGLDFFGLAPSTSTAEKLPSGFAKAPASETSTMPSSLTTTRVLSVAPKIEEPTPYPGWVQNPDGSWIAVTPEAQEVFAAHQAAAAAAARDKSGYSDAHTGQRRHLERLRDQGVNIDNIRAVAANDCVYDSNYARNGSTMSLDAKYAQAAASMTPSTGDKDREDAGGKKVKGLTSRARQKGQLSSLFAQAEEKRESLEEKWAQGRANRNAARERYGF